MNNEEDEQQGFTPSVFNDVLGVVGDKKEAKKVLERLNKNPFEDKLKQARQMFKKVSEKRAKEILKKNGWKLENCIDIFERENTAILKKENEIIIARQKKALDEKRKRDLSILMKNYKQLSKEEVTKVFEECNKDVKQTATKLVLIMKEKDRKQAQERMRDALKYKLHKQYQELDEKLIDQILEKENYDTEKAIIKLDEIAHQRICDSLCMSFDGKLTKEFIFKVLQENNWSNSIAFKICTEHVEKSKKIEKLDEKAFSELKEEERKSSQIKSRGIQNEIDTEEKDINEQVTKQVTSSLFTIIEPEQEENEEKQEEKNEGESNKPKISVHKVNDKIIAEVTYKDAPRSAWLGFYKSDTENDKQYITFNYLCYGKNNTLEFDAPKLNGSYQVRLFSCRYKRECVSEDIVLDVKDNLRFTLEIEENTVTAHWELGSFDPIAKKAYITVHFTNEERYNYYRRYNWVRSFSGKLKFKKLVHAGEYEARLYIGSKMILKSKPIPIPGI